MNNNKKNKNNIFLIYIIIFIILFTIFLYQSFFLSTKKINEDLFFTLLSKGKIKKIIINNKEIANIILNDKNNNLFKNKIYKFDLGDLQLFQLKFENYKKLYKINTTLEFNNSYHYTFYNFFFDYGFFIIIILLFWYFIFRKISGPGGQIFNLGKSKVKIFDEDNNIKIKFKDVAGLYEVKEEIKEIVDFLKNPNKYTKLGGKIPKGALLIGPPGTGKTLLAKAVAGEANVPFFSIAAPEFVEMFVGVGASRVRDLFAQAKLKSPCIIFIDEIDSVGRARGKNNITGANDERENTLNQLLTEMDGFDTKTNVIVIAATNRSDILDQALLRPGRFDRIIMVDLPELNERKEIFYVHIKNINLSNKININFLAQQTPGFSGADIANVCNEAALIAARKGKKEVYNQDFTDAIDRIVGGLEKRNKIIKPNEKKRIAYHEAGHATISWCLEHAASLVKVTIVPRGRSLGSAWYLPEERQLTTLEQMKDEICALLGGRAAEELIFKSISTGALIDLEKVTKQAKSMVVIFGLSNRIGNISYYDSSGENDYSLTKPYSEKTANIIDEEIHNIINKEYIRAKKILKEKENKLNLIANKLLEKEVLLKEDLKEIFSINR
ncbi:MAG: ATP-dependent zinc metalloprotease FtsH [Candidatus Bostrichicola ureolyticus]|nr:MAG: ATP-dependent zinc metalloprotease FtsH [Candidatus Bostrichicola ureolyticus]